MPRGIVYIKHGEFLKWIWIISYEFIVYIHVYDWHSVLKKLMNRKFKLDN